jgi:hypothetical protein
MSCADRPCAGSNVIEEQRGAIIICLRALAAQFIQTVSFPVSFISELYREPSGVEVRPPFAVFVYDPPVSELRPALIVQIRQFLESHKVQDR